jgi:uncharacterized protein
MLKVLLFIAIIWLIYRLLRQGKSASTSAPGAEKPEDMVRCATCGVHLPKSEAISSQNQYFCCEEHFISRKK